MNTENAKHHIEEAYRLLTGEAYRIEVKPDAPLEPIEDFCTDVITLERIDAAIGPKGESILWRIAENLRAVYTEIIAARKELE